MEAQAMQLASGMAGVLIIDGGMDTVPEIKAAMEQNREKILVFQQLPYRPEPGKVVEALVDDVYANSEKKLRDEKKGILKRDTLINGELQPTIIMQPGEIQRWRCVHAGLETSLNLGIAKLDNPAEKDLLEVYEIAVDGLPLGKLEKRRSVLLHPGYRSDFLVQAPLERGDYLLRNLPLDKVQNITGIAQGERFLARVKVQGEPLLMKLPTDAQLENYRLPSIDDLTGPSKTINFMSNEGTKPKQFVVNGKPFVKGRHDFDSKLGATEEWMLAPLAGKHPFHIHVNPFEVITTDDKGNEVRTWRDTYVVDGDNGDEVKVRMRFERYSGKTVLHCHNLRHEDQGMMANFEITGQGEGSRCPPVPPVGLKVLPADAPNWELPDKNGVKKLSDYKGQKVLLVFSRGQECIHCRDQISKLAASATELAAVGLRVLVVVPMAASKLPDKQTFPDAIMADESLATFHSYGCHDGRALHGTFLIDAQGKVRWQDAGDDPFMDVATLLMQAKNFK